MVNQLRMMLLHPMNRREALKSLAVLLAPSWAVEAEPSVSSRERMTPFTFVLVLGCFPI